jgi:hypothetical protein
MLKLKLESFYKEGYHAWGGDVTDVCWCICDVGWGVANGKRPTNSDLGVRFSDLAGGGDHVSTKQLGASQ